MICFFYEHLLVDKTDSWSNPLCMNQVPTAFHIHFCHLTSPGFRIDDCYLVYELAIELYWIFIVTSD